MLANKAKPEKRNQKKNGLQKSESNIHPNKGKRWTLKHESSPLKDLLFGALEQETKKEKKNSETSGREKKYMRIQGLFFARI